MKTEKCSLMVGYFLRQDIKHGKMTIEECVRLAAECNIRHIDVMNVSREEVNEYCAAMKSHEVDMNCYMSTTSFFDRQVDLCDSLKRSMDVAKSLGAKLFMLHPFQNVLSDRKTAADMEKNAVREILIEHYSKAVDLAKKYDLIPCFEIVPLNEFHLSGSEDCAYVLDYVPGLEFIFDTANMLPSGEDPVSAYVALKDKIHYVHLKDVELQERISESQTEYTPDNKAMICCPWGEGVIPVKQIYESLEENNYSGLYGIEYAHSANQHYDFNENLNYLRRYIENL